MMDSDLFGGMFQSMGPSLGAAAAPIPAAMGEWMRVLLTTGAPKISVRMLAQDACADGSCSSRMPAGVRCLKCKKIYCLHHIALLPIGDGICIGCAQIATSQEPERNDSATVLAAFGLLGLDPSSPEGLVRKHAKRLIGEAHPDKQQGKAAQARATARFKSLNEALAIILAARKWG